LLIKNQPFDGIKSRISKLARKKEGEKGEGGKKEKKRKRKGIVMIHPGQVHTNYSRLIRF